MGKKLNESNNEKIPGPLEYAPVTSFVKAKQPSALIGTTAPQRITLANKAQLESPAPDTYFKNIDVSKALSRLKGKDSGPKWTIGQRYDVGGKTTRDSRNQPGPANYDLPPTIGNVASYEKSKMKSFQ